MKVVLNLEFDTQDPSLAKGIAFALAQAFPPDETPHVIGLVFERHGGNAAIVVSDEMHMGCLGSAVKGFSDVVPATLKDHVAECAECSAELVEKTKALFGL